MGGEPEEGSPPRDLLGVPLWVLPVPSPPGRREMDGDTVLVGTWGRGGGGIPGTGEDRAGGD